MEFPYEKDNKERIPFEHYLSEYQKLNPKEAAKRCGVEYDEERQQFHIRLMGYRYLVDFPEFAVHKEDEDEEGAFLLLDMVSGQDHRAPVPAFRPGGKKQREIPDLPGGSLGRGLFPPVRGPLPDAAEIRLWL